MGDSSRALATASAEPGASSVPSGPTPPRAGRRWTFDGDPVDAPPVGFSFARTGRGAAGRWVVRAEPGAPRGPRVLAQLDAEDTDYRFPVAIAEQPVLADVRVGVRCKTVSGRVDQACGLVARYRDADNYLVTRANALENNVRLYFVRGGQRHQLATWSGAVAPGVWHDYRFELRGDHLEVFWDGARVLDHHDSTFSQPGRVGVWTKADSVTLFDDLSAEPL